MKKTVEAIAYTRREFIKHMRDFNPLVLDALEYGIPIFKTDFYEEVLKEFKRLKEKCKLKPLKRAGRGLLSFSNFTLISSALFKACMNSRKIIDIISNLKNLSRTGWLLRGVPAAIAENVAEHSFEAASIAFLIAKQLADNGVKVNVYKAAMMALIHDWSEAIVGDIPRWTSLKLEGKKEFVEEEAFKIFTYARELFEEYLKGDSLEAVVARVSDALATYLQACRYLKTGYQDVEEIKDSMKKKILEIIDETPVIREAVKNFL